MAENETEHKLDLEQILQTLASLPKAANVPAEAQFQSYDPNAFANSAETLPTSFPQAQTGNPYGHGQSFDPRLSGRIVPQSSQLAAPPNRTSTPSIDPGTITEWKHGLRCVNKIATQNPSFVPSVQKLMKDQERNVKDWEAGRQRLIEDQAIKKENESTHRAALSLPGLLDNTAPLRTPEREQEELTQYDQKVYRACRQMVANQSTQLKSLGVPFFGVKPHLILPDNAGPTEEEAQASQEMGKSISKKEILELQRKMLIHLTEMYGD